MYVPVICNLCPFFIPLFASTAPLSPTLPAHPLQPTPLDSRNNAGSGLPRNAPHSNKDANGIVAFCAKEKTLDLLRSFGAHPDHTHHTLGHDNNNLDL
mmetsp:Transcript_6748/g.12208  ORF Transcript_6748/g.12208 Transcript_6748/m.12208 type:complete len:98 (-) Transcript_6748:18-311(-)